MRTQPWVVLFLFPSMLFTCGAFSQAQQRSESLKTVKPVSQVSTGNDASRLPVKRVVLLQEWSGIFRAFGAGAWESRASN